jgi:hypothetical protein
MMAAELAPITVTIQQAQALSGLSHTTTYKLETMPSQALTEIEILETASGVESSKGIDSSNVSASGHAAETHLASQLAGWARAS